MQTDKKVEEYLERAKVIRHKIEEEGTTNAHDYYFKTGPDLVLIEIAKMIQLEEHRNDYARMTNNGYGTISQGSL